MRSQSFSCGRLFIVLFLQWFALSYGQNCSSTDGTCSSSVGCRKNKRRECQEEQYSIFPPPLFSLPHGVMRCGGFQGELYEPTRCEFPHSDLSSNVPSDYNMQPQVSLHSIDVTYFAINVSWEEPANSAVGYQLIVRNEDAFLDCFCLSKNTLYIDKEVASFPYCSYSDTQMNLSVEVHVVLGGAHQGRLERVDGTWPKSCLEINYNSSTCGLPIYPSPTGVTVHEECDSSIVIQWTYNFEWAYNPIPYIHPTEFYVYVYSNAMELPIFFVAHNTTNVRIEGLNSSLEYTVMVQSYVNCSGVASTTRQLGCGMLSTPVEQVSTCSTQTASLSTTTEPTTTEPTTTIPPTTLGLSFPIAEVAASSGGGISVTAIVLVIIVVVVVKICKREEKILIPSIPPIPIQIDPVFVVYVPEDSRANDIQTYVVSRLMPYFPELETPDMLRGDIAERMEERNRKATAVLLVFTQKFYYEWEDTTSVVVKVIRRLLSSAVSQQLLDKYAIVVLDSQSREKYIPDNDFLKSLNVYVLGKEKNQVEDVYRFVTRTKQFEHTAHRDRSNVSPPSSLESCDDRSQRTMSIDISLESQQGFSEQNSPSNANPQSELLSFLTPNP